MRASGNGKNLLGNTGTHMAHNLLRLYTLGPAGTYSDKAAQRLLRHRFADEGPGRAPEVVYTRTIPEVLDRTEADENALGVIPIENSDTGTVVPAQDGLARHKVAISLEINLPIRFHLLANAPLEQVITVFAQPVAYDQCSIFVTERLPMAESEFTHSNTESGLKFLAHQGEGPMAAIVPPEFASENPTLCAAEDLQNDRNNTTRFLVVGADPRAEDATLDTARHKTSLLIEPEEDRPGLLYDMLSVFKRHKINLCRLESRPARVRPWTYVFYLDFNNNADSPLALAELRQQGGQVIVLGCYDSLE